MSYARVLGTLSCIVAAGVAGACDGSMPTQPSPATLARHFDALYTQAVNKHTHGDSVHALALTFLEIPTALGVAPVPVTVTTAIGTQRWQMLAYETVLSGLGSGVIAAAYSDGQGTNVVVASVAYMGNVFTRQTLYADTIAVDADSLRVIALSPSTGSGTCSLTPGLTNPEVAKFAGGTCTHATIEAALGVSFPPTAALPALQRLSYDSIAVPAARIVFP